MKSLANVKDKRILKKILLIFYDLAAVIIASILAKLIVDNNVEFGKSYYLYFTFICVETIVIFSTLRLYKSLWRYASIHEAIRIVIACGSITLINLILILILKEYNAFEWYIVGTMFQFLFTLVSRFIFRVLRYAKTTSFITPNNGVPRVMIIGAGEAGLAIIKEMKNSPEIDMLPCCIIDDNITKIGQYLEGVKIVGNRNSIIEYAAIYKIDTILITMPSVSSKDIAEIIKICQKTSCKIRTLPGIYQMIDGSFLLSKVRDVQVEDLLGREQIKVDLAEIKKYLTDKVVMVTGGGGSIGSELCRQIAQSNPKQLIIFDIYENNEYEIEQYLRRNYPNLNLVALIGSVRDKGKVDDVFNTYRPNIVFHAAAHKHVPLMETSPNEAVKNNVFGTLNVATASDKYGVSRFVMISTDKAVRPTNVMGATKRICEMIVQSINEKSKTEFVSVRFGNVLGSNGSVIPLFKEQIASGGPVTVTDKEITRYFMTIPEAVSLVLQAGSYANGGEIFVLDMGSPVKIYDLAVNLIKLSGYIPNVNMEIKITGLRPGEKLYEELLMEEEGLKETPNKLIYIGKPIEIDKDLFFKKLDSLYKAVYLEVGNTKELIADIVPTYKISENDKI